MDAVVQIETKCALERSDICRACGGANAVKPLSVYGNIFEWCTSVKVNLSGDLPSNICSRCFQKLKISYNFKILCNRTDKQLRKSSNQLPRKENFSLDVSVPTAESELSEQASDDDNLAEVIKVIVLKDNKVLNSVPIISIPTADKSFDSQSILIRKRDIPETRSNQVVRFSCSECKKEFSTKTNLYRHQISHGGVKPFKCNICNKGFTQSGSLKTHMFTHFNIKPFVCNVCGQRFTQNKSVKLHLRRHTGERPFICGICNATFRQKGGLDRHMKIHEIS
ncbi:zinc finger protein OZF-like [Anopheles nili]|uniref:zinc finger protein OZF-like n=1 Tax=Anopheles nili TaxID=185578 RepID=UPI00237BDEC5|nr:zinc finger protein OZF-like [Anopheles nili]